MLALGLAVGAQAAPAPSPLASPRPLTPSSPSSLQPAPLPAAQPAAASAGTPIAGYGEVEWIRAPRAQPQAPRPGQPGLDDVLSALQQESASEWTVELADHTFRQTLLRWTRIANWQLVWEVERDFAIDAQVTLNGNFLQALDQAMTSLRDTDFPVQARINPDTRVVRVVRYKLDGDRH